MENEVYSRYTDRLLYFLAGWSIGAKEKANITGLELSDLKSAKLLKAINDRDRENVRFYMGHCMGLTMKDDEKIMDVLPEEAQRRLVGQLLIESMDRIKSSAADDSLSLHGIYVMMRNLLEGLAKYKDLPGPESIESYAG